MVAFSSWMERSTSKAFAIHELVFIIFVIGFVGCLVAAGSVSSRPRTQVERCLNNLSKLQIAWTMYSDDNQGRIVANRDGINVGRDPQDQAWVAGWL